MVFPVLSGLFVPSVPWTNHGHGSVESQQVCTPGPPYADWSYRAWRWRLAVRSKPHPQWPTWPGQRAPPSLLPLQTPRFSPRGASASTASPTCPARSSPPPARRRGRWSSTSRALPPTPARWSARLRRPAAPPWPRFLAARTRRLAPMSFKPCSPSPTVCATTASRTSLILIARVVSTWPARGSTATSSLQPSSPPRGRASRRPMAKFTCPSRAADKQRRLMSTSHPGSDSSGAGPSSGTECPFLNAVLNAPLCRTPRLLPCAGRPKTSGPTQ